MNYLLLIGCGAVCKSLLELWALEKFKIKKIIVVDPADIDKWCFKLYPQMKHIKIALDRFNLETVLRPLMKGKPFVLDLSVDVDCIAIMKLCKEYGCNYLNTSVEDWNIKRPEELDKRRDALIKRSLVFRENKIDQLLKDVKTTIVANMAQNPGLCNLYALKGISDYTLKYGNEKQKTLLRQRRFAELSRSLGLEEIHCAEIDTQKLKKGVKRAKDTFYNTWSAHGLISESLDPVQIGLGSNRRDSEASGDFIDYDNIRIYKTRGMDMTGDSVTLNASGKPIEIEGRLIPHAEATTLNWYLKDGDYSPTVYYCYKVSPITEDSYKEMIKNGYKPPSKAKVVNLSEVNDDGYDSVCMVLYFQNGKKWITGSVLSNERVKEYGFKYSGCTTVQVAAGVWAGVDWVLKNLKDGFIEPEDMFHNSVLKQAEKYLGDFYSKEM